MIKETKPLNEVVHIAGICYLGNGQEMIPTTANF